MWTNKQMLFFCGGALEVKFLHAVHFYLYTK